MSTSKDIQDMIQRLQIAFEHDADPLPAAMLDILTAINERPDERFAEMLALNARLDELEAQLNDK